MPKTDFIPRVMLSLSGDATVVPGGNGDLTIQLASGRVTLKGLTPGVRQALDRLGAGGVSEEELETIVLQRDGNSGLAPLFYQLQQLGRRSLLWRTVEDERGRLATLAPISPYFTYPGRKVKLSQSYTLSRFAFTRAEDGRAVLESPLAHARLVLHDWRAAALLQTLAVPGRVSDVVSSIPELSAESAVGVMNLLLNVAMLGEADDSGIPNTDCSPALQSWEFHDLLFHARSRTGRHDLPVGGTFRMAGKLELPSALKPSPLGEMVELSRPNLDALQREDPPFAEVLERRRSVREYGMEPITRDQLGEFLYRVARMKDSGERTIETPVGPMRMEFAPRPYPAGGALYELEFYAAVHECAGLAPGLYHYDPEHHRLGRLAAHSDEVAALLGGAAEATGIPARKLQVLVIVAARFQRLAWKYAAIAYALVLKHVGIVYQTMYLAATAMNLAPCAVGCGNADLFARATGADYYDETSVGEFLLGSLRDSDREERVGARLNGNGKVAVR